MKNAFVIALKDFRTAFTTPLAYVVIAGFLFVSSFFFLGTLSYFNTRLQEASLLAEAIPGLNEWVLTPFFRTLEIVLLFLIPIVSMSSFSEEKRSGTFELLLTSPIEVSELVLGKFLGVAAVVFVMLLLSFVFPLSLILFAEVEVLPTCIGFLGLLLFAFSYVALGVAISSATKSQTIAGVLSFVVMLLFYVINAPAGKLEEPFRSILNTLAPSTHTEMMLKGVLLSSDLVYFLSLIAVGLFVANRVLDAERWR